MAQNSGGSEKPPDTASGEDPMDKHLGRRMKLGELLIQAGLIDEKSLDEALALQKVQKKKIGQVLIDMGIVDDIELARVLADQLNLKFTRLDNPEISDRVIAKVPAEIAERYSLIPLKILKGKLVVAMANPLEFYATEDIRFVAQMPIHLVVSPLSDILAAIDRYYQKPDIREDLGFDFDVPDDMEIIQAKQQEEKADEDLLSLADLPPVVRFANAIIAEGIRLKASDIHIEPQKSKLTIRCRVDGIMRETMRTDKHVHAPLVSRIKVLSGLDISVRRRPQDGKAQVNYSDQKFDLRISTIPTSYGEKVTIRILNPASAKLSPEDVGFSDADLQRLTRAIYMPQGIILVTGPTGSGKSSTLYACLNKLNTPSVNIITVEDPVEFDVEGINQVQINPKAGITFAAGLRSILRQDPDIVMVGEIRDKETAAIAFQAAQTGHMVLSTLHTNDAPSAVTRLLDLEVEDFQINASLVAVIGQRLVRRIHPACKEPDNLSPQVLSRIRATLGGDSALTFFKGAGCPNCLGSGYSGRMGIFEILEITPAIRDVIAPNVSAHVIQRVAETQGFQTMAQDGIRKALKGLTSIEEVFRVAATAVSEQGATATAAGKPPAFAGSAQVQPAVETSKPDTLPTVLVVDDDEITVALLRRMLESRSYRVVAAKNGVEALAVIEKQLPDLVVTDLHMPEMNGIQLIKALKSRKATSHIPVIMLTVEEKLEAELKGFDVGAEDYLIKPVNTKRFLARVGRFFMRRERILVVDDDPEMLVLLQRILEPLNYLVLPAKSGREALPIARSESPDLVITDFRMPDMDGVALIRELKGNAATRHIPIIMLTAKDEIDSEVAVFDAGADDYLTKPFNKKRLLIRIKRLFRSG